ncbi:MAG: glycosyltransferase family 4 protein [Anaerolineales bacterium]|nr:glycosyltransferase family 4 protein [Anaerolineales bacterium]
MTPPSKNRIAWAGAWSRGHNNARQEELLPRLDRVDRFYVDMHPCWPIRGVRRRIWLPLLMRWLGARYPLVYCTDWRQIRRIHNAVVCDHDDPLFGAEEIRELNRPNVAAVVVTSESVSRRLADRGLRNPAVVIPQGVSTPSVTPEQVKAAREAWTRSAREVVAGIHQPHFEFSDELPADSLQQMYAVDRLLEAMECARRKEPRLVLWLVGEPSRKVREYAERSPWVRLTGYQRRPALMEYVAAFDIGLYPRALDLMGRASIKVLEYMACGVPVVGFDVEEMVPVKEAKAGIAARDPAAFAAGLIALARDKPARARMGAHGIKASAAYHWEVLAQRYAELLDRCLERSGER